MTLEQAKALRAIGSAVVDACDAAGALGAPGGHIYAALMTRGCTLQQFEQIMSGLVRAGMVAKDDGHCYIATDKGRVFAAMKA